MSEDFKDSQEYEEWIEETVGRDEEYSDYYNEWLKKQQKEWLS